MQATNEEPVDSASSLEQPRSNSRLRRGAGFLREAVVGSQQDFTEGSIGRAIFLLAVPMGLSMATTATVARRIGEKDHHVASIAAVQSIILGVVASIPVGIIAI